MKHILLSLIVAFSFAGCTRSPGDIRDTRPVSVQSAGEGGPARIELIVSPTELTTAQRVSVRLEARLAPGVELEDVDLAQSLQEGLSIIDARTDRRAADAGATAITREWTVEPFLAGEYEIGALTIAAKRLTGNAGAEMLPTLSTKPVLIRVASVLQQGEQELAEAKSVVEPPPEPLPWLMILLGGVLALGLIGLAIARIMRPKPPPPPVFEPAHTVALRRLESLMSRRLVDAGRFKEFYEEASLILRRYIEDRFGLHAPERTTEEFLEESRASAFLMEDDVRVLQRFMSHCDLVKFAAVIPSEREAGGIAGTIREFIERTRDPGRLVQVEPEAAAGGESAA